MEQSVMLHLFSLFILFHIYCNQANIVPLNECTSGSTPTQEYFMCKAEERSAQCGTYAVLRANSYYSSLANLSLYLGLTPKAVGISPATQLLPKEQHLLLPINCRCNSASSSFEAELVRTTAKGDSLHSIIESLEGLTTCKALADRNPSLSKRALPFSEIRIGSRMTVPIKCSCPTKLELVSATRFLISYPVRAGDTLSSLAAYFNVTKEAVIAANNNRLALKGYYKLPGTQPLVTSSTILIPVKEKPVIGSLAVPKNPTLGVRPPLTKKIKKKKKKGKVMIAAVSVVVAAVVAIAVATVLVVIQRNANKENTVEEASKKKKSKQVSVPCNKLENGDAATQQFNLSIRTTSEKKLSFEGSVEDGVMEASTPHKTLESYTVEEINRATDDFDPHNLVQGPVYHGRIRGRDVAVKCTPTETFPKVDFTLFQDSMHSHPNILRLYGACFSETTPESFLVFEYAKNGSLKDWIHGGLAVKSQFIASCSCFLTWTQRLRICLDVAMGLQYMHQIMSPPYVHRNIKSRNVFLDSEFHAKIGNFGMARCVEEDNFPVHLQFCEKWNSWNKAYMAPELRKRGSVSTGVDVYAYGVVLLEVLSGQKPVTYAEDKVVLLSERIKAVQLGPSTMQSEVREWMDSTLGETYSLEAAVAVARLARACVEDDPRMRPNAGEIVERLSAVLVDATSVVGLSVKRHLENEGSSKPLVVTLVD